MSCLKSYNLRVIHYTLRRTESKWHRVWNKYLSKHFNLTWGSLTKYENIPHANASAHHHCHSHLLEHPWRYLKEGWMWRFEMWFSSGPGSVRIMVGFNDLRGLFQPIRFWDSLLLGKVVLVICTKPQLVAAACVTKPHCSADPTGFKNSLCSWASTCCYTTWAPRSQMLILQFHLKAWLAKFQPVSDPWWSNESSTAF